MFSFTCHTELEVNYRFCNFLLYLVINNVFAAENEKSVKLQYLEDYFVVVFALIIKRFECLAVVW